MGFWIFAQGFSVFCFVCPTLYFMTQWKTLFHRIEKRKKKKEKKNQIISHKNRQMSIGNYKERQKEIERGIDGVSDHLNCYW